MVEFEEHGRTIEVYLNEDHKFFKNVYSSRNSSSAAPKHWDDLYLGLIFISLEQRGKEIFFQHFLLKSVNRYLLKLDLKRKETKRMKTIQMTWMIHCLLIMKKRIIK